MKVLHLIYTHGIAGAEKYLKHLLPPLKEYGVHSHLILVSPKAYSDKLADYVAEMTVLGIPAQVLEYSKKDFFKAGKKIAAYTKQHDIIFLHSHLVNSDVLAVITKKLFNKKLTLISTKHGYSEDILKQIEDVSNAGQLKTTAMRKPYYYITWLTLKMIPHNFAVSNAMALLYQKLGFTKKAMPFIHHGVNVAANENFEKEEIAGPLLLIIGRLEIFKGHEYLIKAMPEVVKHFPACKLIVLGEGSQRNNFENLAASLNVSGNILFKGFHPNPYTFIKQADVVVIPSLFEPFGLVFIEAIALQKPVAGFNVAAGNEILTDGQTALLATRANYMELAKNIVVLLKNEALRKQIAANAFAHYQANFTTAVMVKNTFNYYKSLTKD